MALFDVFLPLLESRLPAVKFAGPSGEPPQITNSGIHPEVGDIMFYDDGDEITVLVGHFTHSHFSNYDQVPISEKEQMIAEQAVSFLEELFADRIIMWGSHRSAGGWRSINHAEDSPKKQGEYVWSGPRQRLTMRCSERLRAVTACAASHADPPTTDPLTAPSAPQPTPAAFARTGCASPPPSLSLGSLDRSTK